MDLLADFLNHVPLSPNPSKWCMHFSTRLLFYKQKLMVILGKLLTV